MDLEILLHYYNQLLKQVIPRQVREEVKRWRRQFDLRKHGSLEIYTCPVCYHKGRFIADPEVSYRYAAICAHCGAQERHRLQALVLNELLKNPNLGSGSMLHFAPEPFFVERFKNRFERYETADYYDKNQQHVVDIRDLPFADESYDFVYASHVLEHVDEDRLALREVYRILRKGGVAVLPVPIVVDETIEYPEPSPTEFFHVRAPGVDYFDRYREFFDRVDLISSDDFSVDHQTHIIEDRSVFPNQFCPYRTPQSGDRHLEYVPICYRFK